MTRPHGRPGQRREDLPGEPVRQAADLQFRRGILHSSPGDHGFRLPLTDVQAFGVLRSNKLLIAYGDRGQLWLARSEDGGETWRAGGELKAKDQGRIEAEGVHITQLADGTVLLPWPA